MILRFFLIKRGNILTKKEEIQKLGDITKLNMHFLIQRFYQQEMMFYLCIDMLLPQWCIIPTNNFTMVQK
jgi:hypothetical protein